MTAQNDFVPFATGVGANTISPAAFRALTAVIGQGFQAGTARSDQANTAWRQASTVTAMIGEFIKDAGYDALDNGDIDTLEANFLAALRHYLLSDESSLVHFAVDTGTANHVILSTVTPNVTGYANGLLFLFLPAANCTGASDFKVGSLDTKALKRADGTTDIEKGDIVANRLTMVIYAGGVARLMGQAPDVSLWHQGSAAGGSSTALTTTLSPPVGVLVPHLKMRVPIPTANGAAATLDFGFGAKPIVLNTNGNAVSGGEMPGGVGYEADLQYDGTSLRLMNPIASSTPQYGGATDSAAGTPGTVPAPPLGGQRKVPLGSGGWGDLPLMVGASSGAPGKLGAVPAPAAGDQLKFFRGDGLYYPIDKSGPGVNPAQFIIQVVGIASMGSPYEAGFRVGNNYSASEILGGSWSGITGVTNVMGIDSANAGWQAGNFHPPHSGSVNGSIAGVWKLEHWFWIGSASGIDYNFGLLYVRQP